MIKHLTSRVSLTSGIAALLCALMFWPDFILRIAGWFWPSMIGLALIAITTGTLSTRWQSSRQAITGVALGALVLGVLASVIAIGFVTSVARFGIR